MEKAKILFVTSEDYDSSIQRDIDLLARFLDPGLFEIAVACPHGAPVERFESSGARVHVIEMPSKYDLRPVLQLAQLAARDRPSIVHTHTTRATLFASLALVGRSIPLVQSEHLWTSELVAAKTSQSPLKSTQALHRLLTRTFIDRIIVLSEAMRAFHVETRGLDPSKVTFVRYSVEPLHASAPEVIEEKRRQLGIGPNETVVSCFGRFDRLKGQTDIISAIPSIIRGHPDARFCFFGKGGEDEQALKAQAAEAAVQDRTLFGGWRQDVADMMEMSDIVLSPSLSEAAARIAMEAMSLGRPLVISDIPGLTENVGDCALVVPPKDPAAIAQAVCHLLTDEALRQSVGEAGRERYDRLLRPECYAARVQEVYMELLPEPSH